MDTSFLYFWEGIFQNPMLLISALFTLGVILLMAGQMRRTPLQLV